MRTILVTFGRSPGGDFPVLMRLDAASAHFYLPFLTAFVQQSAYASFGAAGAKRGYPLRGLHCEMSAPSHSLGVLPHTSVWTTDLLTAFGLRLRAKLPSG